MEKRKVLTYTVVRILIIAVLVVFESSLACFHEKFVNKYLSTVAVETVAEIGMEKVDLEGTTKQSDFDQDATLNVTHLVLTELKRGFFAAARENLTKTSEVNAVCVSEPTVLECLESGFAALLLVTLDHISFCQMMGVRDVVVHWRNCHSSCAKDPLVNSWPAYFETFNNGAELKAQKALCLGGIIVGSVLAKTARSSREMLQAFNWTFTPTSLLEVSFRERRSLPGFENGAVITPKLRRWAYDLLNAHVRPRKSIQSRVDEFYEAFMHEFTVLGVHVRGTDHGAETESKSLPPINAWIQEAEEILRTLESPKKIFIASDNYEVIDLFVQHFGQDKVLYTDAIRAQKYRSDSPINGLVSNETHPINVGIQVLVDVLLLAKCGHFLHAESSVASLASYFNPNMKLYFLGDRRGTKETSINDDSDTISASEFDSKHDCKVEWEDDWAEQLEALQECFLQNAPYSTCPNMARGQLIEPVDVANFLGQL